MSSRKCFFFFGSLVLSLAKPASAQEATLYEEAALSQRLPTAEERLRQENECQIEYDYQSSNALVALSAAYQGRVVNLHPQRGLLIYWIAYEGPEKGTFAISSSGELPLGGIAGFDICEFMTLMTTRPVQNRGDVLRYATLRLRSNLDLSVDYPTANAVIDEKGLLAVTPASKYVEIYADEPNELLDWIEENKQQIDWLRIPFPIIGLSDRVLLPMK
ncbi:hypothetical protein SAMN05444003_2035 [Cognatiyoonia sediminum]|uniref:Uncharacterized protein n=1 Tax=Cognatiyoonia sediminum TaxID=1508389 RepID=A0A1M5Q411_9RHOB|nr:hypothetical protein [Cognatiyoonia sediminum]SHH08844.1 hypothetical protein SAMN05444003_2035 [Cognatiyoonia sediminum]